MTSPLTPESIRELRRRLGLSQAAFAARLDVVRPGTRVTAVSRKPEAVVLETDGTFSVIGQRGSSASAMSDVQGYCQ